MANLAYVRVSTIDQHEDRQIEALQKFNIDKWFTEKISGKNTNRPELQKMLDYMREGDTVYIKDFSRLARSTKDLLSLIELFDNKGVALVSEHDNFDLSTATGRMMLKMLSAINDFERENMLERQKEGIAICKERDKQLPLEKRTYKGRKAIDIPEFDKYYQKYLNRELNKSQLAKELKISRPTLDKLIKEHNA